MFYSKRLKDMELRIDNIEQCVASLSLALLKKAVSEIELEMSRTEESKTKKSKTEKSKTSPIKKRPVGRPKKIK